MTKSEAIKTVNSYLGRPALDNRNTRFSKVNSSKDVWWLNIPINKFSSDVHLVLAKSQGFIWIKIPTGSFPNLSSFSKFKIREDIGAVDLEISCDKKYKYLCDIKSGGSEFDFEPLIEFEF